MTAAVHVRDTARTTGIASKFARSPIGGGMAGAAAWHTFAPLAVEADVGKGCHTPCRGFEEPIGEVSALRTATGVSVLDDHARHGGMWTHARCLLVAACVAVLGLVGCGSAPEQVPKTRTAAELMSDAQVAVAAGDKQKARETYRAATQADPTAKAPWLKLAESYFESADYGHAVLAAEEALHRDGSDSTAAGILAVSGLRISTSALATLRGRSGISEGTRGEAENLARTLRELLGEPVLVPKPAEPASAPTRARAKPNAAPSSAAAAPPRLADPSAASAPKRAPRPATGSGDNPFDRLK